MTIGEAIRSYRNKKKMSQKKLGDLCGIADSAIRKYESGKVTPKFETIKKIAAALEVPESQLLGLEEATAPKDGQIKAERLLSAIEKSNLSYGELSKLTGIPKASLQKYATGSTAKIPVDRIMVLANTLHVTVPYLMGWTDDPKDEPPEARKPQKGISLKYVLDMAKSFQGKNDAVTIENMDGDKFYVVLARPGYQLCWDKLAEREIASSAPAVPVPEAKAPEAPQHDTLSILKVKGGEERPMYEAIINLCGIKGVTLARLCFDLKLCRADIQALNGYQNGFISEPTLEKIAQYLNTTPADLKKEADRMKGARQYGISSLYKENVDPTQNTLKISRQYEPSRHFVELTPETFQELQSLAKSSGRSMDYLVEALLEFALARVTVVEEDRSAK